MHGLKEMNKKSTRNRSTKTRIILPFVVAKALNWWYRYPYPRIPRRQGHGKIIHVRYPDWNESFVMVEITERK